MKQIFIDGSLSVSRIALGFMRLKQCNDQQAERLLRTAVEGGINFFDHADIYGDGVCEEIFSRAVKMSPSVRESMILQSKCGICKGYFDLSKEHILKSVDAILSRLHTDYLDILLLHRPDALMDPDEVADAFDRLQESGKVRRFGVSNMNPMQIELLQKSMLQKLTVNQIQLGVAHANPISVGINVNMENESAVNRDGSVLDYCRLKGITVQAWSPFRYGQNKRLFVNSTQFDRLNYKLDELGEKYGLSRDAMAVAWLLRHPAGIQTVVGTTNADRLKEICAAGDVELSRQDWYEIYRAAGNILP